MTPDFWLNLLQVLTPLAVGVLVFVAYWIRIRFLTTVFRHAGKRKDLRAAGAATRIGLAPLVKVIKTLFGR